MNPGFLAPLVDHPDGAFGIRNTRTGDWVATHVETAFDSASRRRGLLGRGGLDAGRALVIAPSNAVHTFFMKFPIDVIFVRRDGRVIKVRRAVPPGRLAMAIRAFATIELTAGGTGPGVSPGDRLQLDRTHSGSS